MEHTLTFSDRQRYTKALAIIARNPKMTAIVHGRDHSPNITRPWSTLFYITFQVEV